MDTTSRNLASDELLKIDPASLGVEDQARSDTTPDEGLIESVKQHGVLQPPTVYWNSTREQYVIVMGHRRTGAAIIAGLPIIKVIVMDAAEAQTVLRLQRQVVENERREPLAAADTARSYRDMKQLFGMTPEDIASSVGEKPERVKAALKAVQSVKAEEAMELGLDLEQAAIIADFEGDDAEQERLTIAAISHPADFARAVVTARAAREVREAIAPLEAQLEAEGVELVKTIVWDAGRGWHGDGVAVAYGDGRTLERLGLTPEEHASCPGAGALIENTRSAEYVAIVYVCKDYREHHADIVDAPRELTPEEAEREAEWERQQEEREQRRAAIAANDTARRDWLRGFIGGRLNQTPGIFDMIAGASLDPDTAYGYHVAVSVYILTGETHSSAWDDDSLFSMIRAGKITALRGIVANALGLSEKHTTNDSDRPELVIAYFKHLVNWGYQLSEIDTEIKTAAEAQIAAADEDDDESDD